MTTVEFRDFGRMEYGEALALQRQAVEEVVRRREDGGGGEVVFLVEHDPSVITVSRRPDARRHLTASESQLKVAGVTVAETDRGGDITYHGPGQLVVYPILDLNRLGLRLHGYMRLLEQTVIETMGTFGVQGERDSSATGVWVSNTDGLSKICAMGVRVSRWVTMHGLALNVTTNMEHFDLIVPCGLAGRGVTSMERLLGPKRSPTIQQVKRVLTGHLVRAVEAAAGAATAARNGEPIGPA